MPFFFVLLLAGPIAAMKLRTMIREADGRTLAERERVGTALWGALLLGLPFTYGSALNAGAKWWLALLIAVPAEALWGLIAGRVSVEVRRKEAANVAGTPEKNQAALVFLSIVGPIVILIAWTAYFQSRQKAMGCCNTDFTPLWLYPILQFAYFVWITTKVVRWGAPKWVLLVNILSVLGITGLVVLAFLGAAGIVK